MKLIRNSMYAPYKILKNDIKDYYLFHKTIPGYKETPLLRITSNVYIKDESHRLDSNSFKILGVSSAVAEQIGKFSKRQIHSFTELYNICKGLKVTVCTASDGNFGVSCAQMCKMLNLQSLIFIPFDTPKYYINEIVKYGGAYELVIGDYDRCVERAISYKTKNKECVLILDTAILEMQVQCAKQVMGGYKTIFSEIKNLNQFDYIFIQSGVGGLLAAAVCSIIDYKCKATKLIAVEPKNYNCLQLSIKEGKPIVAVGGETIINGLKCKTVSSAAWDILKYGVYSVTTVSDADCFKAFTFFKNMNIETGYTGACAYSGYWSIRHLIPSDKKVLCINTERAIY